MTAMLERPAVLEDEAPIALDPLPGTVMIGDIVTRPIPGDPLPSSDEYVEEINRAVDALVAEHVTPQYTWQNIPYNDGGIVPTPEQRHAEKFGWHPSVAGRQNGKTEAFRQELMGTFTVEPQEPDTSADQVFAAIRKAQEAISSVREQLQTLAAIPGALEQLMLDMVRSAGANAYLEYGHIGGRAASQMVIDRREHSRDHRYAYGHPLRRPGDYSRDYDRYRDYLGRESYCYCSPSRGMFHSPEYRHWSPPMMPNNPALQVAQPDA